MPPFHVLDGTQEGVTGSEGQIQLHSMALVPSLQEKMFTQAAQQSVNTAAVNTPHCRA